MQSLRLSPDGQLLSYIGPDEADTPQLWVRDLGDGSNRQLTHVAPPGVTSYVWAENTRFVCHERRDDGNPRLVGLELVSGTERFPLAHVKPISFEARDGVRIHGYLTLPVGVPARKLPLVVWVHGGPYLRDAWGYDRIGQLFVNRGYAFLRINFRGSRGFGRQFKLISFKQWGGTMQNDIIDGVEWVVRRGIADPTRMAIIGHSYGGYVALAALTLTPDLFACGAASSTTTNLMAFVSRFPKTPAVNSYRKREKRCVPEFPRIWNRDIATVNAHAHTTQLTFSPGPWR